MPGSSVNLLSALPTRLFILTGGRYQFSSFYESEAIKGMYVTQRIGPGKSINLRRKPNIKPAVIDLIGSKAVKGELTDCELNVL